MKVLFFGNGDFFSRPNPGYHLQVSLILDLMHAGCEVCKIGLSERGLDSHIPEELLTQPRFSYILKDAEKKQKSKLIKRYLSGISYALWARKQLKSKKDDFDIIYFLSTPTVVINILLTKRIFKKAKKIYNVQDMFPGSTIASGKMTNKLMQKFFYGFQKLAYKNVDCITAISEDMKTKLIDQGVPEEKIRVIVNWFDDQSVREIQREENLFIQKYNMQEDKFYVQYAGTMGYVFDYKMVIKVAQILKDHTDIVFQMIGAGSQKDTFIEETKNEDLDNIQFLPLEPQEMVSHVYSACDVCFIPLKKGIIGNSVPSKAGLLMACRRAIVTTADEGSDYNRMINEEHIGIACSTDDPNAAADAILRMKDDEEYREYCANSGYEYGKVLYSRTENTAKYIKLMESLVEK